MEMVVAKAVLARFVARTKTAGLPMNVVFRTSVLIVALLVVVLTQTAVQDNTVVRKNIGTNSVSAVITVLENLVTQTMIVAIITPTTTSIGLGLECIAVSTNYVKEQNI